ncbi:vitamin K-dependent gamma-carboxylase [Episyrphus balteatus]|uniref:vitamin K-dependent gamma-carboxylase n=1 Tax=Episyrphus balteatus TaxID=286459 RepID=UPI0024869708|nr:vitamin K-dependent gamma-carboxylase [Episyrphus balteatus]
MSETDKKQQKISTLEKRFKYITSHDLNNFTSFDKFTQWLKRPVDGAALGIFRAMFGAAMLIDIAEERGGSQMDLNFGDERTCHFPLFDFIQNFSLPVMGLVYLTMWLGALGIALGYNFRLSCLAFVVPYWYIMLLNKPAWNNHSYLFGLSSVLLMMTDANRFWSFDYPYVKENKTSVPYWNYFLIKFQFFILYAYAGLKKFSPEWLAGYAMSNLGNHWVFAPFRTVLSVEMTDLLIIHWFTAIFDFSIPFLMTFHGTRKFATPFMLSFHLMNTRLFSIGMFPWVCLAEVPLFFDVSWPRKISEQILGVKQKKTKSEIEDSQDLKCSNREDEKPDLTKNLKVKPPLDSKNSPAVVTWNDKIRTAVILMYCCIQLFLPFSHFITKGYNNWTNGLYGYSWDMMVHSYDTILTSVKVVDNKNGNIHYLEPFAFTHYDRWTKSADMAKQYAKCIHRNIVREISKNPKNKLISSSNISIYFDIWCSMNGRFQQRTFNPNVDILQAHWSPFEQTTWSLPLINELNHMRPKLKAIADDVLSWSNYSDVVFVADFPNLTLDNFLSADLGNITLTVIEGSVIYKNDSKEYILSSGQSMSLTAGEAHQVTTTSKGPSCYQYTYVNTTMERLKETIDDGSLQKNDGLLPLWTEFLQRISNYKIFVRHILNSLMFIVYKVPMEIHARGN